MPTDLPAPTSQIDADGFPVAIGFQAAAVEAIEADSNCEDCNPTSSEDHEQEETQSLGNSALAQQEPLTGYELVADMMRRQDEVLLQLDDLNARVESAIKEISAARKSELETMEAETEFDSDSVDPADQAMGQRKAA